MIIAAIIARALFWAILPAAIVSAMAATIRQQMPAIRALLRAAKEL
jgi:hypothetical protein